MSAIFVSQPLTVYEVDFSDSWFMICGWLQNRQSRWLLFVVVFWLFPSQKMGCSTQILFNHQISCFKAMPSFYGQKNDLLKCLLFFGSLFSCISLIFLELQFPIFLFWGDCGCSIFFGCCWPFFLRCFIRNTTYLLLGGAKKVLWIF